MVEAFGRSINKDQTEVRIKGITMTENVPNITHQQYANDTILPTKSSVHEARGFKSIIQSYMDALRQKVNKDKSEIFFLFTNHELEDQICRIMGYKKAQFPCKYLGISLEKGSKSKQIWIDTMGKMDGRSGN